MALASRLVNKKGSTLQMQDELLREDGNVIRTSAGQELDSIISERVRSAVQKAERSSDLKHQAEIAKLLAEQEKLRNTNVSTLFCLEDPNRRVELKHLT